MLEIVSLGRTTYSSKYFLVLTAGDFGVSSFTLLVSTTGLTSGFPETTNFNPTGNSFTMAGFNRSNSCMVMPYFLEMPYFVSLGSIMWYVEFPLTISGFTSVFTTGLGVSIGAGTGFSTGGFW